ncbi:hypothetical protein IVB27_38580 [Bradyrhizobium sp. 197]|uniref:hypothetical protein n=1 Tax=Bradyrhizobium sp. 197 TaxID=2782663 RepID=UPI001FF83449|nr:hypothetical protein [Bradyrhizobium sp. 197]MCK1480486.1 hypothetical protein [Bradyrhizobium sp. 197]
MASRRHYKAPQGYRDGGRVPAPDDLPQPVEAQEPVSRADVTPTLAPEPAADDALRMALGAQLRAEEMARRPRQEPVTPDTMIDAMPISAAKKEFLRQRPELLRSDHAEIIREAHSAALQSGIEDDSAAMFRYLGDAVTEEMQARRQRLAEAARSAAAMQAPPEPTPTIERMAEQLGTEAQAYGEIRQALGATPAALGVDYTAPASPPPRARIPMSAPVSRDGMSFSGVPAAASGQITLTPEERAIARNSFSDPHMSNAEKERSYAMQKAKLRNLRQAGLYPERERQ